MILTVGTETITADNLFHRLWTKAAEAEGYSKAEWLALEKVVKRAEEFDKAENYRRERILSPGSLFEGLGRGSL